MKFEFELCLPRDAISVPFVRHLCRAALENVGAEDDCTDDIELAVSEACSNVLRHAADTEHEYELRVEIKNESCTIHVIDRGAGFEESALAGPELSAESGRGIHLMRHLVDHLNFESKPETGTVVKLQKTLALKSGSIMHSLGRLVNLNERTSASGPYTEVVGNRFAGELGWTGLRGRLTVCDPHIPDRGNARVGRMPLIFKTQLATPARAHS